MTMIETARMLCDLLDESKIPYVIGGSMASSAWGQPRQTVDVDLDVILPPSGIEHLLPRLDGRFIYSEDEIRSAVASTEPWASFQLLQPEELVKFDVFVSAPGPYTDVLYERRQNFRFTSNSPTFWFMAAEDIVLFKLRWFDLGNRVSDRQWNDIAQVIEVRHDQLDRDYIRTWAAHFGVQDLAEQALRG